ncbi:MAG: hypothetical protein EZS28_014918 [Streblomastix strix]|uniref:Cyclin N-terminal domain-containing protein n=1 Tax=Streblomastix strix TaxID=222440 RepID=A0A5J4W403_9EUKA|nr:MAG: hypothetical protein EZS28_014918 [Streblomastix strix]
MPQQPENLIEDSDEQSQDTRKNKQSKDEREGKEIHGQERWVELTQNQDLHSLVENSRIIDEEIPKPKFDCAVVPNEVLKFAAFCVSRVITICDEKLQHTASQIEFFLSRMRNEAGMRTTELIQALALIDIISKRNVDQMPFELTHANIYLVLLVCVMIAHKSNCDKPYSNGWWSRQFGATLPILNESEVVVLRLLDYNTYVPMPVYQVYHSTIFLADPQVQNEHANLNEN